MNEEKDLMYDSDDSVKFIQNYLPQELKGRFNNDDIMYILDLVDDYYIENDLDIVDGDDDDDEEAEKKMIEYIIENAKNDEVGTYTYDEIIAVLDGECAYCETIYSIEED